MVSGVDGREVGMGGVDGRVGKGGWLDGYKGEGFALLQGIPACGSKVIHKESRIRDICVEGIDWF